MLPAHMATDGFRALLGSRITEVLNLIGSDLAGVMQFELTDTKEPKYFSIRLSAGRCQLEDGIAPLPRAWVRGSASCPANHPWVVSGELAWVQSVFQVLSTAEFSQSLIAVRCRS